MTKRLRMLFEDAEWCEIQRAVRAERTTVAEWVRQALRVARRRTSANVDTKISAIRDAARHEFPTADIDQMNAEIARGSLGTPTPPSTRFPVSPV